MRWLWWTIGKLSDDSDGLINLINVALQIFPIGHQRLSSSSQLDKIVRNRVNGHKITQKGKQSEIRME
jgi:hypothetical protein